MVSAICFVSYSLTKVLLLLWLLLSLSALTLLLGIYGSRYSRMDQVKFVDNWSDIICLGRPYHFKLLMGVLTYILLIIGLQLCSPANFKITSWGGGGLINSKSFTTITWFHVNFLLKPMFGFPLLAEMVFFLQSITWGNET